MRNGQRVRIRFTNNLPVETTIHWHGIGVPSSQDGVPGVSQTPIKPGESFTYEFTTRPAGDSEGGGTLLYHTHVDEDRQMPVGVHGSFVIDPPKQAACYAVDRNFFTINGKSYPETEPVEVPAGKPVLLRLIHAGQFAHPLHLHGTSCRVVARDGHAAPRAIQERRDSITLESGERADIAFTEPRGEWLLHCHIGHHLTNDGEGPGGLITLVKST